MEILLAVVALVGATIANSVILALAIARQRADEGDTLDSLDIVWSAIEAIEDDIAAPQKKTAKKKGA